MGLVLIETLWNVKSFTTSSVMLLLSSINRNIVECKDISITADGEVLEVLIETLWNVKKPAAIF